MLPIVFSVLMSCLVPPVSGPITSPFVEPACIFCAGHRAIEFRTQSGQVVVSPVTGKITFVGWVVNQTYVTLTPDTVNRAFGHLLITVGGVGAAANFRAGSRVRAGGVLGNAESTISLSVRRTTPGTPVVYLDPAPYLAQWRTRARLVPSDGSSGRLTPQILACRASLAPAGWGYEGFSR
ncbi:MAG: hypothetical protein WCG40_02560 [Actinomycetes bacterium]